MESTQLTSVKVDKEFILQMKVLENRLQIITIQKLKTKN